MNKSFKEKNEEEIKKSHKRSGHGHLDVRFNNDQDTNRFDVRSAEERADRFVVYFSLFEGGEGAENRFIEVVVYKSALSQRVDFPDDRRANFLFQSAAEEWRPAKGWIRAEWNPVSKTFEGLLGDVESSRPENTKVTWGKFHVTFD